MDSPLYIDVHIVQTVPPSNLNRDDAGSPKQAIYGGARRARVSSQAWKRATRKHFVNHLPEAELATRTKKISSLVTTQLARRTGLETEPAARLATHLLAPLKIKAGKKASETAYLLFLGRPQIETLVELIADQAPHLSTLSDDALGAAVKDLPVMQTLSTGHPIDVALFGRMVADIPSLNVDAATQVAHALSTHPVEIEFDYYTAVDDESGTDTGAGMIGTVEFNSATLYRFATVGLHQLRHNLGGDIDDTLKALQLFLTAFTRSMPTGHQNAFGHRTVPSLVAVAIRDDQPVNLVSAFESPVRSTHGIAAASALALVEELQQTSQLWGLAPASIAATYAPVGDKTDHVRSVLGDALPFEQLVTTVTDDARRRLTAEEA